MSGILPIPWVMRYTDSVSPRRIKRELMALFAAFAYLVETANQHHQAIEDLPLARRASHLIELLIGDCANRLKEAGFDQIRDLYDRGRFGLISTSHARIGETCGTISSTLFAGRFCSSSSPFGRGRDALFSGPALEPSGQRPLAGLYGSGGSCGYSSHHGCRNIRLIERLMK